MNLQKIKEILIIISIALLLASFFYSYSKDIYASLSVASLFITLYYYGPKLFALKNNQPLNSNEKIGVVLALIFVFGFIRIFIFAIFPALTNMDFCNGWAKSEEHCAIEKVKEQYYSNNEYDDY